MKLFKDGEIRESKKKKLIDEYPTLTEGDFKADDEDKLLTHLEDKLGITKSEMRRVIHNI